MKVGNDSNRRITNIEEKWSQDGSLWNASGTCDGGSNVQYELSPTSYDSCEIGLEPGNGEVKNSE